MRRFGLALLPLLISLGLAVTQAQAAVVDMDALGRSSVQFNDSARTGDYGVALVPSARTAPSTTDAVLNSAGVPFVASSGQCEDPALTPDLVLPDTGLCWHGGPVIHRNETFALTWDPTRSYWSGTRSFVEQFLRDVADGSNTLTSPFALTSQYSDGQTVKSPYSDHQGRAQNESVYGGGCIDYGNPGDSSNQNTTCLFGGSVQTGPGFSYPISGCTATGESYTYYGSVNPPYSANTTCLTDAQLRTEVTSIVEQMGIAGRTQPGYSPIIDLLLPPGVVACLDAAGTLCSANASAEPSTGAPDVTSATAGGTVPAGTYTVETTYVTATGETQASPPQTVTTTGDTSTITVSSPPAMSGATGWYAYITQAGGGTFFRQQSSPTAIGTSYMLTSAPSTSNPLPARFCSYHSQVTIGGKVFAYVVQPWTAMTDCDEPDSPTIPANPGPAVLGKDVGIRLVSPLSQAQIAAIVNPQFNGWFAQDGSEIGDFCVPEPDGLDKVTVGQSSYLLQREFNNAALMEPDPYTYFGCAPNVILSPSFVVPSPIDQGESVSFDGSTTASTLIVPNGQYQWNFGDGTPLSYGASVAHSFAKAGYYRVTLTVTDRGWNTRTVTQTVEVMQSDGQPPSSNHGGGHGSSKFKVHLQLLPQSLKGVLHDGLQVKVSSNEKADGFATLTIPESEAKKAHIHGNRTSSGVVVGRGTVSGITDGTDSLRVKISSSTASRLSHLKYLSLTLRLDLTAKGGTQVTAQATGHY